MNALIVFAAAPFAMACAWVLTTSAGGRGRRG